MNKRIGALVLAFVMALLLIAAPLSSIVNAVENTVTIKFHYTRPDGKYSEWDIWTWGAGGDKAISFVEGEGEAVATLELPANPDKVGFLVRKPDWTDKDIATDRFVEKVYSDLHKVISGTLHVYLTSGQAAFTVEADADVVLDSEADAPELPPVQVKVHYYRADGNYDGWNVFSWGGVDTTAFEVADGEAVATIYANANTASIGFIVRYSTASNEWANREQANLADGNRMVEDAYPDLPLVEKGTIHVYVNSGDKNTTAQAGDDVVKTGDPVEPEPVEVPYYVAGTAALCGSEWANNDPANKMSLNADGLYEKSYENVPAGKHEFKVTDGTWDNCWGDNGNNYTFTTTEEKNVTITFNAETKAINVMLTDVVPEEDPYYVAGTAALCGSEWANNDPANKMSLNADGLYEKSYENVPAGKHEFKVTDGTWDNCWGDNGNNYTFTTTEEKNVTITFNAETKAINVMLTDVAPEEDPYYVAGVGALCGSEWNCNDPANKMSLNADGLYEKTYQSVPAGTYEFKVTDGTWDNSWGKDGGSENYSFTTTTETNVTITFNAETKEINVVTVEVAPYYVAGTEDLCGVAWEPGYAANKMALGADGLYTITFKSVPAGDHEFKVTDGTWSNSWGQDGGSNNYAFSTTEVCNVTITFNAETKQIEVTFSEATPADPILPPEPEDYDITIKVHYFRADGDYTDWEVHMWNGVESLSSTRKFDEEDENGWKVATYYADASDTWVGFIVKKPDWTKDPDGDRKIDISNVVSGTVHVYAVSGSALEDFETDKSEAVLGAKITAAVYDSQTGVLTVTTSMPIDEDPNTAFMLEGPDGEMTITSVTQVGTTPNYVVEYVGEINTEAVYKVYYNGAFCTVTVPNVYSTEQFEAEYTYTGSDLGANWTEGSTTFRLWAPTASAVSVNLYATGSDAEEGAAALGSYAMTKDVNGTWIVTVEGDLNGVYYTYSVTRKGETVEACDPYAKATGVNGDRAMVIDLDSTDPAGWENDNYVTQSNYTDAVIWELHVRDFSIDESSGMTNKGKYLAFTEKGTTVPGTDISTGIDYMVDLGVNYVHLLPVYDINSVDETTGGYNWGYDPKNYNVPEGSYSTNPYDGAVRVNEFKQMVQSLHDAGIGVVMDVVYNHVADAGQFCFNQIVPGYFSRIHDDGSYQSNSGCGNDTASERSMVSKYIVDSVLYWAEEYHIDGFRWDLVGLIDVDTINATMEAVHAVNPDIIFYGEGWEMCTWTTKEGYKDKMTIQPNDHLVNTEAGVFAFFNDTIRNVIHGGVFTATDKGFVAGNLNDWTYNTVVDSYMGNSTWGSNSSSVDTPLQTVNYASCHDNYTLFDNLTIDAMDMTGKTAAEVAEQAAAMNKLAAAYYITAQGVPFIHAGEEMLRSKPDAEQESGFNHNSFSSGDAINSIKWDTLADELVDNAHDYYQGLIAFRAAHDAMRMTSEAEILAAMSAIDTGSNNIIAVLNEGGNGEDAVILSIFNADAAEQTVTLPEGEWEIYVNAEQAGTTALETVEGTVTVSGTSAMILVKVAAEDPTDPSDPTDPEPSDPSAPTDPEPSDPEPSDPSAPTDPEPSDPTEPGEPEQPTKPGWISWFEKWFGSWWGDDEEECEHTYTSVVTDPTCTNKGYTTHTCTKCGDSYKDSYVNATGHEYEDGSCIHCGKTENKKPGWGGWFDWFWPIW